MCDLCTTNLHGSDFGLSAHRKEVPIIRLVVTVSGEGRVFLCCLFFPLAFVFSCLDVSSRRYYSNRINCLPFLSSSYLLLLRK